MSSKEKASIKARIVQIRKRVREYHKHKNDPYAYYPDEIGAIREFNLNYLNDIKFLLAQV